MPELPGQRNDCSRLGENAPGSYPKCPRIIYLNLIHSCMIKAQFLSSTKTLSSLSSSGGWHTVSVILCCDANPNAVGFLHDHVVGVFCHHLF